MTGPIDGSRSEPGSSEVTTTASEPIEPIPPQVVPDAPSGWVSPGAETGRSRRTRGCVIVAAISAFVLVPLVLIGLVFLGAQVQSLLKGTIEFGTGGTGCSVTGEATTFPTTSAIHLAAHLEREVPAGQTVTLAATSPDGATQTNDQTLTASATCLVLDLPSGLGAGHYVIEVRSASEVLAKGAFEITP